MFFLALLSLTFCFPSTFTRGVQQAIIKSTDVEMNPKRQIIIMKLFQGNLSCKIQEINKNLKTVTELNSRNNNVLMCYHGRPFFEQLASKFMLIHYSYIQGQPGHRYYHSATTFDVIKLRQMINIGVTSA